MGGSMVACEKKVKRGRERAGGSETPGVAKEVA